MGGWGWRRLRAPNRFLNLFDALVPLVTLMLRALVIAHKELLQLARDRLTAAMMLVAPVIQLLVFGFAIDTDVRHMPTVVYDQSHSAQSRDLPRSMEATGYYDIIGNVDSYDEIDRALRSGKARVGLVVPATYAEDIGRRRTAHVELIVDGCDPQVVASATNTAASLVAARSGEMQLANLGRTGAPNRFVPSIEIEPSIRYNPELRTAIYIVPGLVGAILTITMVMLTSMAIARERERGTLEQLIVSPVRSVELIVGKLIPYIGIGYVQMTLVLAIGHIVFGVPVVGSIVLLYGLALVFIAANLALGLVFSTLAQTQQQAMQVSVFFLLPNLLLSGFMFPFEAMPAPAQWLAQGLPLTHFLRILRAIVLKGSGFADFAGELVWLCGILLVLVTFASLRFSKKLV
ncbi:MAG: ABC transporter permease [Polyangiaceae bacterium]|nr:ABC transporter permease [Polyangiaceae bacterium]